MTFMLILAAAAALCLLWILFRFAGLALPLSAAIALAFWLIEHGWSLAVAAMTAIGAGTAILLVGRMLFFATTSAIARLLIVSIFAVPAGIAGYSVAHGIGSLATDDNSLLAIISAGGALAASVAAWKSMTGHVRQSSRDLLGHQKAASEGFVPASSD